MARKDRKKKSPQDVTVVRLRKGTTKQVVADVKRLIAVKLAEKYAEDPKRFDRLVEVGLIDEATLQAFPDGIDFDVAVAQFRDRLAAMAAEQPSVLGRLELRPLDVLSDSESTESSLAVPGTRLSVVFSDLEGFTSFTSRNGDTEASALLRDHYDAVDSIVRGRGGAVVKTIGDGHMLSFGEPRAAVLAGVELAELDAGPLQVRVGGHDGPVVQTPDDLLGHVVNVAARVTDTASGGETLVTTSLRDGAGPVPGVVFEDPREEHLKGIEEPFEVCRVHHEAR